jgi:hypothetical protein
LGGADIHALAVQWQGSPTARLWLFSWSIPVSRQR